MPIGQAGKRGAQTELMEKSKLGDVEAVCHELGLRVTEPRRAILKVLAKAHDHPDVSELHRRVSAIDPSISLATVYRTVKLLEDKDILARHTFGDGKARYETADQEHHDHLIDIETGKIIELRSDEIERLQEEIARKHGYRIIDHKLEIFVAPLEKPAKSRSKKPRK